MSGGVTSLLTPSQHLARSTRQLVLHRLHQLHQLSTCHCNHQACYIKSSYQLSALPSTILRTLYHHIVLQSGHPSVCSRRCGQLTPHRLYCTRHHFHALPCCIGQKEMSNTKCMLSSHDRTARLLGKHSFSAPKPRAHRSNVDIRASATIATEVLTPHPDALTRRKEAELRWDVPAPSNVLSASTVPELQHVMATAKAQGALLVVKFFAPHCVACKSMYPKVRQVADKNSDVLFLKVNAGDDELRQYCESVGVSKIPFFHMYKAGTLVAQFSANLTTINRLRGEIAAYKA